MAEGSTSKVESLGSSILLLATNYNCRNNVKKFLGVFWFEIAKSRHINDAKLNFLSNAFLKLTDVVVLYGRKSNAPVVESQTRMP